MVDEVIYRPNKSAAKADEDSKLEAALNRLGSQGWELVMVEHDSGGMARYIFKRPK
jgi:hypothetical protein